MIPTAASVPRSRYVVFLAMVAVGLTWDLYSKWAVFHQLGVRPVGHGMSQWVWPDNWGWQWLAPIVRFRLDTNFNYGALWGMGQGMSLVFAGLSVVAAMGILYWLFIHKAAISWWLTVALGFVMPGVLGNLFDRLGLHGWKNEHGQTVHAVRDFLHFWFFEGTPAFFDFAIFNFADSYLVTGAIMLIVQSLLLQPATAATPAIGHVSNAPTSHSG